MAPSSDRMSLGVPPPHLGADSTTDPFSSASSATAHHRYSNFDTQLFSLGPSSSPAQARRALEAHLAETERRIQEASRLGTSLVDQRRELAERLKEVETHQSEDEITPELRQKLVDIEKEYNEVGRESARAFLPKSRVSSSELGSGSPMVKRSASPTKFESNAVASPSKLSVPNRKQRNQQSTRVHDIEFATEISTSLLSQVRNLQSMLAEKEEALRIVTLERSRLEVESEGFDKRLRSLDESEHRYKDENWNLETQIHEHIAAAKEAAEREKRLAQAVSLHQFEKTAAQKELDEIKLSHAKLAEEHAASVKHHDTELGGFKRNLTMAETERDAMNRKIAELTSQNQELAVAFAQNRARAEDEFHKRMTIDDGLPTTEDDRSPNESPPLSPIKGTPRHSALETETLKSSLGHAHRMIQGLKGNIHKEKTEKLELKRMLQDARDELDTKRSEATTNGGARKSRKLEPKDFKKPSRPGALGGARSSKNEVYADDPIWEDHDEQPSPTRSSAPGGGRFIAGAGTGAAALHGLEESANETSDAFETANERQTETDDFQTSREDSSDELTETEASPATAHARKRPSHLSLVNRMSFQSTASDDDDVYGDFKTPSQNTYSRNSRPSTRDSMVRPRAASDATSLAESQSSYDNSNNSTPIQPGNRLSLFAELNDLDDYDEEETDEGTPASRRTIASPNESDSPRTVIGGTPRSAKGLLPARGLSYHETPVRSGLGSSAGLIPSPLKVEMVDSGMMTEDWQPLEVARISADSDLTDNAPTSEHRQQTLAVLAGTGLVGIGLGHAATFNGNDRHLSTISDAPSTMSDASSRWQEDQRHSFLAPANYRPMSNISGISQYSDMGSQFEDMEERLASFPSPPTSPATPLPLVSRYIASSSPLTMSTIATEHVEPIVEPEIARVPLSMSAIYSEQLEPIVDVSGALESPREMRLPSTPARAPLAFSTIEALAQSPREPPRPATPTNAHLELSSLQSVGQSPRELPRPSTPVRVPFAFTAMQSIDQSPREAPRPSTPTRAPLALSTIQFINAESPTEAPLPDTPVREPFAISTTGAIAQSPKEDPALATPVRATLVYSSIGSIAHSPRELPRPITPVRGSAMFTRVPASLTFSTVQSIDTEPIAPLTPEHGSGGALAAGLGGGLAGGLAGAIAAASLSGNADVEDKEVLQERMEQEKPQTPKAGILGSMFGWGATKQASSTPFIAEDETRQSVDSSAAETPESQRPLREMSGNANETTLKKSKVDVSHEGSQTALTSAEIDNMLKAKSTQPRVIVAEGVAMASPIRPARSAQVLRGSKSTESFGSVGRARAKMADPDYVHDSVPIVPDALRPLSSKESVSSIHPPLPMDHKQVIAAAASRGGSAGSMGPPLISASALKANPTFRPRTPSTSQVQVQAHVPASPGSVRTAGTANRGGQQFGSANVYAPTGTSGRMSRQSSVSSFASEVDSRFNLRNGMMMPQGFEHGTDPRMIQAITQTMIGEYLWKYTRKAGRGEMSENRHRRYFWVHPYTRTLYWSDRDPSQAGRAELKAKSVAIEAVRVVTDDNPMPPGLHRKSLIILTPGRAVKFTATTGQRHETWFNALSYLLLRTDERGADAEGVASGALNKEDVADFNPTYGSGSRRGPASLSSYNSRTTRNDSPIRRTPMNMQQPTLNSSASQRGKSPGPFSRLSNYWKPGSKDGSPSTATNGRSTPARSRSRASLGRPSGQQSIYDAPAISETHDSAEDLREMLERQDRESDKMENVRACCDGKHDVSGMHVHQHHHHHHSIGSRKSKAATGSSGSGAAHKVKSQASIPEIAE